MDPRIVSKVKTWFERRGYRIERVDPDHPEPWSGDREFLALHREVAPKTLVTIDRCFVLHQLARLIASLPGPMAEVGSYRGGTARLIARTCPGKSLHVFDTFEGMPHHDDGADLHRTGDFADTSLDAVRAYLADCPNVTLHPGRFPATAVELDGTRFSFVHLDVDVYQSTRDGLEYFFEKLTPGGVMVLDDYGWKDCPGVARAVKEFQTANDAIPVVTARYQCALFRLPRTVAS